MASELMQISFYNSKSFFAEARTISSNYSRLSISQMFLFLAYNLAVNMISKFPLLSISKKEKDEGDFLPGILSFYKFWLSLFLGKVLIYCQQPVCLLLFIVQKYGILAKISIFYGGQREAHLEPIRTSTMELFSQKKSIKDIRLGSKNASGINHQILLMFHNSGILIYPPTMSILCSHKRVDNLESFISLISLLSTW